ncbi:ABC transporter ATP-binding protein [Streptomyces sp. NPDC049040]|uniref:ABC transporter ATP-binding protein n=1 Tax=Streptomyces sp. NPDC049040 TaxID=3365593 RepID=UPI00371F0880
MNTAEEAAPVGAMMEQAIETRGVGKRYGRTWALRDCTLAIPAGRVVALVGPNGAGKTTLLQMVVGLTTPTTGRVRVAGGLPAGSSEALNSIGFVAQDTPLYPYLSVADTLRLVAGLSATFDEAAARAGLAGLGIPSTRKVGKLSGGQYAQVALAVALARRPRLLVLDEPVARLDPLARHDFMATLMSAVAENGLSVLFSSHVVAELERVCDYLVVLSGGKVQVAGEVDALIAGHHVLTGPTGQADPLAEKMPVVHEVRTERQTRMLVRVPAGTPPPPGWQTQPTHLEELVLSYLRTPGASALPGPSALRAESWKRVQA